MKKLFVFLSFMMSLFFAANIFAENVTINGINYSLDENNSTATVIAKSGTEKYSGSITIPSSIVYNSKTYNITTIGSNAFKDCKSLTAINIPNKVTKIEYAAFYNSGITSITIPKNIKNIEKLAFANCNNLTTVNFNADSCADFPYKSWYGNHYDFPFENDTNISTINIGNNVKSIGGSAFQNCIGIDTITCATIIPQLFNIILSDK